MSEAFKTACRRILPAALILSLLCSPAAAADVYGRVYDTLRGSTYPGVRVRIDTEPARETVSDGQAQYWFRDVPPGVYLVHLALPGRDAVTGRLLVAESRAATIANLDLAKIAPPEEDDEY